MIASSPGSLLLVEVLFSLMRLLLVIKSQMRLSTPYEYRKGGLAWRRSRLDRVGGWVFTHDIEQIFEYGRCLVVWEVLLWRL